MKLIQKFVDYVREETYVLEHPKQGIIYYKEFLDKNDTVIDTTLRNEDGHDIDCYDMNNANLLHEIWNFIDGVDNNSNKNQ